MSALPASATSFSSKPLRSTRGVGRNSGRRGSLRTDAHWQSLLAGDLVPEQLQEHVRHRYAVWHQAAERVRALDLTLGDSARERPMR